MYNILIKGSNPANFPFLGRVRNGVDMFAQVLTEHSQQEGDIVIIIRKQFILVQYDKDVLIGTRMGIATCLRTEQQGTTTDKQMLVEYPFDTFYYQLVHTPIHLFLAKEQKIWDIS